MYMAIETIKEWGENPIETGLDDRFIDDAFKLIEAKILIRKMQSVCEKALTLRNLAENTDLFFSTPESRQRRVAIEAELHRIIAEAAEFSK